MILTVAIGLLLSCGPSPADLAGRSFFVASEVEELTRRFNPSNYVDGEPEQVTFKKAGRVVLQFAQEDDTCSLKAKTSDGGTNFDLALDCRGKTISEGHWQWLDAHRAVTDLLLDVNNAHVMTEVVEPDPPLVMKALFTRFDADYAAQQLPLLAGLYKDDKDSTLTLAAGKDGHPSVTIGPSNQAIKADLLRCDAIPPLPEHAPCLVERGSAKKARRAWLFVDGAFVEGKPGEDIAYNPFEKLTDGRSYRHAMP